MNSKPIPIPICFPPSSCPIVFCSPPYVPCCTSSLGERTHSGDIHQSVLLISIKLRRTSMPSPCHFCCCSRGIMLPAAMSQFPRHSAQPLLRREYQPRPAQIAMMIMKIARRIASVLPKSGPGAGCSRRPAKESASARRAGMGE